MSDKSQLQTSALFDYLSWRGDLSFEAVPLCEVDSLILSILAYIDFTNFVREEPATEKKPPVLLTVTKDFLRAQNGAIPNMGLIIPKETVTLLARAAKTPRFGLTRPFCYVNKICDEEQKQFSAISFSLGDKDTFIAFRGTDDTLVGWKENFNMSFMHPVPAQREAVEYLESIAARTEGKIYLGGHSKGGNLAVYAATKASESTRERIVAVYNNDGPGFDAEFIHGEDYKTIKDRIYTLVPQSSVVGMLLEHEESYTVVKSRLSGLLQHNGFSWEVMGGSFIRLDSISEESKLIDGSLHEWLEQMSVEEREAVVDSLYEALSAQGAKTLSDLGADKKKIVKAWSAMDNEARNQVRKCVNIIFGKKKQPKEIKDLKE
ncbi:MAG: DUF2974 domain-containing protein [Clostridia bacterium]|nr:DUF2974 domain-containing protein [Clostridia bacterium]